MVERIILAVVAAAVCGTGAAQTPGFEAHLKQRPISAADIVKQFEAPALTSYVFGPGDEVSVDVWGHEELSGKHVIGPDGKITVPIAGVVQIADLDREAAHKVIQAALAKFYADLSVTLRVERYTSYRVFVLGRVGTPGALQFESQPTLLDVVTRASGMPITGGEKAEPGRCAIIRRDQMVWVDLKRILTDGDLGLNIRLARNDLIYMPDATDRTVYVLGEVKRPGPFRLTPDMTLVDAYSLAGGGTEDATDSHVELVRSSTGAHQELRFKDVLAGPLKTNYTLEDGDIIYVPRRAMAKFGYVLQKVGALAGFAVLGTAVTR
jgi:polysaccharide export outer membrane protein